MTKPFRIKNKDGTDKNLTGLTVKWYFITRAGVSPSGNPITGTVSSASTGQCTFDIPANFFTVVARYVCQINMSDGADYNEDTEEFIVDVDNPRQRSS